MSEITCPKCGKRFNPGKHKPSLPEATFSEIESQVDKIDFAEIVSKAVDAAGERNWDNIISQLSPVLRQFIEDLTKIEPVHRRLAFAGPTGVGKTTLYCQIFKRLESQKDAHGVMDKTREVTVHRIEFGFGSLEILDTPGLNDVHKELTDKARRELEKSDMLVYLIPADPGPTRVALEDLKETVEGAGISCERVLVVLSKHDLLTPGDLTKMLDVTRKGVSSTLGHSVPVLKSSVRCKNCDCLAQLTKKIYNLAGEGLKDALVATVRKQLASVMIGMCDERSSKSIYKNMAIAAGVGAAPIPFADMPILCALQVGMVRSIGRIYGHHISYARALSYVALAGTALRAGFRQLAKLVPIAGWVIAASVAASGTYAIGKLAQNYFRGALLQGEHGVLPEKIDKAELSRLSDEGRRKWREIRKDIDRKEIEKELERFVGNLVKCPGCGLVFSPETV